MRRRLAPGIRLGIAGALALVGGIAPLVGRADPERAPTSWSVLPGIVLQMSLPPGEAPIEQGLPEVDVSSAPGAKVVLRRGVGRATPTQEGHANDAVVAICVGAPGAALAPEMVPIVFDKLDDAAKAELTKGVTVDRWDTSAPAERGFLTEETFSGEGSLAAGPPTPGVRLKQRVEGRIVLAFHGEGPDALACTVACTEFSSETARVCPAVLASTKLEGPFVAPPHPGFFTRFAVAAATKPLLAAGVVLGLALMITGIVVAAWPQRREREPLEPA